MDTIFTTENSQPTKTLADYISVPLKWDELNN